jgi:hypothetical protein
LRHRGTAALASLARTLPARHSAAAVLIPLATAIALVTADTRNAAHAAEPDPASRGAHPGSDPEIESYIADGMKAFDLPGFAIGIVANDKLIYA